MANPQLEDGFVRIANELLLAIIRAGFSGSEYSILLFIINQTYGYNQKSRQLSASYISNGTGMPIKSVRKYLKRLVDNNVVISKSVDNSQIKSFGINKNYNQWVLQKGEGVLQKGDTPKRVKGVLQKGYPPYSKRSTNTIQIKQDRIIQDRERKPSLEEIKNYCLNCNYRVNPERFFNHYEAIGWLQNGMPIVNWQRLLDNWEINEKNEPKSKETFNDDQYIKDQWGNTRFIGRE